MLDIVELKKIDGGRIEIPLHSEVLTLKDPVEIFLNLNETLILLRDLKRLEIMAPISKYSKLDFLEGLYWLKELYINAMSNLKNSSDINACKDLVFLGIGERTFFDFGEVDTPQLSEVVCFSQKVTNIETLLSSATLVKLELWGFKSKNLSKFSELKNIHHLRLWEGNIKSTDGIGNLKNLAHLDLGRSKLEDINDVGNATMLKWLGLQSLRKIHNIDPISNLDLEFLIISDMGVIQSLAPIEGMKNLRELNAYNTIFTSEDLSVLFALPSLQKCSLEGRYENIIKSYNGKTNCEFIFRK